GLEDRIECVSELSIPVTDQEPEPCRLAAEIKEEITRLLGDPRRGRVSGDTEHMNPAGGVLHDSQTVQPYQDDGLGVKEVNRQYASGLCLEELAPARAGSAWRRIDAGLLQDGPDGRRRDLAAEAGQFSGDAPIAPGGVFDRQPQYELADCRPGWRPPLLLPLVRPAPVHQVGVLAQQCARCDQHAKPAASGQEPGERCDDSTVGPRQA